MQTREQLAASCTCPTQGPEHSLDCPLVRGVWAGEVIGHVKVCPLDGQPCSCLPGSTAYAYCAADSREQQSSLLQPAL